MCTRRPQAKHSTTNVRSSPQAHACYHKPDVHARRRKLVAHFAKNQATCPALHTRWHARHRHTPDVHLSPKSGTCSPFHGKHTSVASNTRLLPKTRCARSSPPHTRRAPIAPSQAHVRRSTANARSSPQGKHTFVATRQTHAWCQTPGVHARRRKIYCAQGAVGAPTV